MATVSAKVFGHHQKKDGTFNVKIVIYHKKVRKYIDTVHYVTRKQLDSGFNIKDPYVNRVITDKLIEYRESISSLDAKLNFFTCETLVDYLRIQNEEVNFIEFIEAHIQRLIHENREPYARCFKIVKNSLIDYFRRDTVSINEIHSNMLFSYERFLRSERTIIRTNQLNQSITTIHKGLSDGGLHNHMRDLRTLFNAACAHYNNEDLGLYKIKHYPFKKYKIGSTPLTPKRNITIEQLKQIRDCQPKKGSRAEMARDLFMLSFYLCGMNAVDLYNLNKSNIKNERIEYNRAKTRSRRRDKAFISIKLINEAKLLLKKYIEKLPKMYTNYGGLDSALSLGMKSLRELTGLPDITFYWARHTFANAARNECRMSKDDVALALNHIDEGHRTTDIYIAKDWRIVDDVQEKVMGLLRGPVVVI